MHIRTQLYWIVFPCVQSHSSPFTVKCFKQIFESIWVGEITTAREDIQPGKQGYSPRPCKQWQATCKNRDERRTLWRRTRHALLEPKAQVTHRPPTLPATDEPHITLSHGGTDLEKSPSCCHLHVVLTLHVGRCPMMGHSRSRTHTDDDDDEHVVRTNF